MTSAPLHVSRHLHAAGNDYYYVVFGLTVLLLGPTSSKVVISGQGRCRQHTVLRPEVGTGEDTRHKTHNTTQHNHQCPRRDGPPLPSNGTHNDGVARQHSLCVSACAMNGDASQLCSHLDSWALQRGGPAFVPSFDNYKKPGSLDPGQGSCLSSHRRIGIQKDFNKRSKSFQSDFAVVTGKQAAGFLFCPSNLKRCP